MADELDIEAMLEAPYRKVRPPVCPHYAPHSARLSQTLMAQVSSQTPAVTQPISTHTPSLFV